MYVVCVYVNICDLSYSFPSVFLNKSFYWICNLWTELDWLVSEPLLSLPGVSITHHQGFYVALVLLIHELSPSEKENV